MSEFTAYAIRQKSTGHYLPMRWNKRRGYSFDEPTAGAFPRLLTSLTAAKLALGAWLKGKWEPELEVSDWDGGYSQIGASPTPVATRRADDMEIVQVTLAVSALS